MHAGEPLLAAVAPNRYAITPEQVMAAMQEKHLPLEGVTVKLGALMSASVVAPALQVKTVSMNTPYRAQLKMACRNPRECLAFYVAVSWPADAPQPMIPPNALQLSGSSKAAPGKALAGSSGDRLADGHVRKDMPQNEVALKAGAPATLVIDDERVHIRLKVVCLQAGAAGDKIRVSTPDHKQAYEAEVVTPTLLKGSL